MTNLNATTPRPRRKYVTLSLRLLLVLIALLAIWLGWITNRARRQAEVVKEWRERDAVVQFDYQYKKGAPIEPIYFIPAALPPAAAWLRGNLGEEYFREVVYVAASKAGDAPRRLDPHFTGPRPDDEAFRKLASLGALRSLVLRHDEISDVGFAPVANLGALERLYLDDCPNITDAGLAHLRGLRKLKYLNIANCPITDQSFAHLANLPALATLIVESDQIGDAGLVHLKKMRPLEFLAITSPRITDAGVAHLSGLTRLNRLFIKGANVTDAGLVHVASLRNLERLSLIECRITDEGVNTLRPLASLRQLGISTTGSPLTDRAFEPLKHFKRLEVLGLYGGEDGLTQFSSSALLDLVDALPALNVLTIEQKYFRNPLVAELRKRRPSLAVEPMPMGVTQVPAPPGK